MISFSRAANTTPRWPSASDFAPSAGARLQAAGKHIHGREDADNPAADRDVPEVEAEERDPGEENADHLGA